jgi:hypothetical protein
MGILILVAGIVVAGIAVLEISSESSDSGTSMYLGPNGHYYSNELTGYPNGEIDVSSNVSFYLIPSQDLNSANLSNIQTYAVSPTYSAGNASVYTGLGGTYYVVTFGSGAPRVAYASIPFNFGQVELFGVLVVAGVIAAIAGFVIAILGAVLRSKNKPLQQF